MYSYCIVIEQIHLIYVHMCMHVCNSPPIIAIPHTLYPFYYCTFIYCTVIAVSVLLPVYNYFMYTFKSYDYIS